MPTDETHSATLPGAKLAPYLVLSTDADHLPSSHVTLLSVMEWLGTSAWLCHIMYIPCFIRKLKASIM